MTSPHLPHHSSPPPHRRATTHTPVRPPRVSRLLRTIESTRFWIDTHRGAVLIVTVIALGIIWWLMHRPQPATTKDSSASSSQQTPGKPGVERNATPSFSTLLPAGKTIDSLGGWAKVSPENAAPVYAYTDSLDGSSIIVSQQTLPDDLATGDLNNKIAELAKSFNATDRLPIAGGVAYVGTSEKGPQSVIASKNNLLILIKSTVKHSDDVWTGYLASLH